MVNFAILESGLGQIILVARDDRLISLDIERREARALKKSLLEKHPGALESTKPFRKLETLLDRYLRGQKVDFDVPYSLEGMGDFTKKVLLEVKKIPWGRAMSYGAVSKKIGYANAARAVGQAVGRNPIPIVIPCHRVLQGDGGLGGFGLGLHVKERLLALEGFTPERSASGKIRRYALIKTV
jgi:methylated-DNA-[protein]-cysteine S-methyltransferase